jgi:Ni/Co efflux regulator RcnB
MWRRLVGVILLALALAAPGAAPAQRGVEDQALRAFAQRLELRDIDGFVAAVNSVRATGRLPSRWITKPEAERRGWHPGDDVCRYHRGGAIGGDRFGNYERRLPERNGRTWREADLDYACGRRGAKRLVWSSDGMIYVTVDHYANFREVPK